MAEISRKRVYELVRGVLKILLDQPEGVPAKTVLDKLESVVPPTPFENSCYPDKPNVRRYEKIVRFGTIQPVKDRAHVNRSFPGTIPASSEMRARRGRQGAAARACFLT